MTEHVIANGKLKTENGKVECTLGIKYWKNVFIFEILVFLQPKNTNY